MDFFSIISSYLHYDLVAVMMFWTMAIGIWPYLAFVIWWHNNPEKRGLDGRLVIVRGGDEPNKIYFE